MDLKFENTEDLVLMLKNNERFCFSVVDDVLVRVNLGADFIQRRGIKKSLNILHYFDQV